MNGFPLLQLNGVDNNNMKTKAPKVAVGIAKECWLTIEWD